MADFPRVGDILWLFNVFAGCRLSHKVSGGDASLASPITNVEKVCSYPSHGSCVKLLCREIQQLSQCMFVCPQRLCN